MEKNKEINPNLYNSTSKMMKYLQSIKSHIKTDMTHYYKPKDQRNLKTEVNKNSQKKKFERKTKRMVKSNRRFNKSVTRTTANLNLNKNEIDHLTMALPGLEIKAKKVMKQFRKRKDIVFNDRPFLIKNEKIKRRHLEKSCRSLRRMRSTNKKFSLTFTKRIPSKKNKLGRTHKKLPRVKQARKSLREMKVDERIGNKQVDLEIDFTGYNWIKPLHIYDPEIESPEQIRKIKEKIASETVHGFSLREPGELDFDSGEQIWKKCTVEGTVGDRLFLISWLEDEKLKVVGRLNLRLEWENEDEFLQRRKQAQKVRYEMIYFDILKEKIEREEFSDNKVKVYFPVRVGSKILRRLIKHESLRKNERTQVTVLMNEMQELYHFKIQEFFYFFKINKKIIDDFLHWMSKSKFSFISYEDLSPLRFRYTEITEDSDDNSNPFLQLKVNKKKGANPTINFIKMINDSKDNIKPRVEEIVIKFYYKRQWDYSKRKDFNPEYGLIGALRKKIMKGKEIHFEKFKIKLKKKINSFYLGLLTQEFFDKEFGRVLSETSGKTIVDLIKQLKKILGRQSEIKRKIKNIIVNKLYDMPSEVYFKNLRILTKFCKKIITSQMCNLAESLSKKMEYFLRVYSLTSPVPFILRNMDMRLIQHIDMQHRKRGINTFEKLCLDYKKQQPTIEIDRMLQFRYVNTGNNFENDRNLLKSCIISLLSHKLDYSDTYRYIKRAKTGVFDIKFSVNKNQKNFSKFSKENRLKFIMSSRDFLFNFEDNEYKVVKDSILQYLSSTSNSKAVSMKENKILGSDLFVNGKLLGWLNFEKMLLKPTNGLSTIITQILNLYTTHLSELSVYTPLNFIEIEKELFKTPIDLSKKTVKDYLNLCQGVCKYSLIGLFSLVFIIDRFKYIFMPKKLYVDTILSFNYEDNSSNVDMDQYSNFIMSEVDLLKRDQKFIKFGLKDEYIFGVFRINLKGFKQTCDKNISHMLKGLHVKATEKFAQCAKKFSKSIVDIKNQIKVKPGSLEEFIKIKNRIKGTEFSQNMKKLDKMNNFIQSSVVYLDKLRIDYESGYVLIAMESKMSLKFVQNQCHLLNQNLKVSKFEFYDEVMLYIKEVLTEFEQINDQLDLYEQIKAPDNPKHLADRAKELYKMILKLIEKSEKVQHYQRELEIKVHNFDQIKNKAKRFKKFVDMWNFFYIWEKNYGSWLKRPIQELELKTIQGIIDEGQTLLKQLYEFFSDNESQRKLAVTFTRKINTFNNQFMDILQVILHPAFNERHWKSLLSEVYYNKKIPNLENLSIEILTDAGIKNHKSLIEILNKKAISEYQIDQRIKSVENSLINMNFKPMSLGSKQNFTIMVRTKDVLTQLQHHKLSTQKMMNQSEHLELFLSDIFRIVSTITTIQDILTRMIKIQTLLLESKNFKRNCKMKFTFTEEDQQRYNDCESEFLYWMDELRSRGFKYILELCEIEMSKRSYNFIEKLDRKIKFLKDKILKKLNVIFNDARKVNPRLYYVNLQEAGDILLEISNVRFFPETFHKLFPEVKNFKFKNETSINGFYLEDGSFYPTKLSNIFSKSPLKDLKGMILSVSDAIEGQMVQQSNSVISFFATYPYEYQRFWDNTKMKHINIQIICASIKAIFFHDFCYMLGAVDKEKTLAKDIPGRIEMYKEQLNSNLRKLNYMKFSEMGQNMKSKQVAQKFDRYLLCLKVIDEFLQLIISEKAFELDSFRWFSTPKHSFVLNTAVFDKEVDSMKFLKKGLERIQYCFEEKKMIPNMLKKSGAYSVLLDSEVRISINVYDFIFEYGYKSFDMRENLIEFSLTERLNHHIMLSLAHKEITLVKGLGKSGKSSAVKTVASICGRHLLKWNSSHFHSHDVIINMACATMGSGSWLLISNLHHLEYKNLSVLSTFISEIRGTLKQKSTQVNFMNKKFFDISTGAHILATIKTDSSKKKSSELDNPIFAENFRCCSLLKYDFAQFINNYISDFSYADKFNKNQISQISKRILLLLQMMTYSLNDKLFLVQNSISLYELSRFVEEVWNFELNYKTIKFYMEKIKLAVQKNKTAKKITEIIFEVFFEEMSLKVSKHRLKNFCLVFNSIFRDDSDSFIQDFKIQNFYVNNIPNSKEFLENNKISESFLDSHYKKLEKLASYNKESKNFIIYGKDMFYNYDIYTKMILYFNNEVNHVSNKLVEINLDVLDNEDLFGNESRRFEGILQEMFNEKLIQMFGVGVKQKMSKNSVQLPCLEFTFSTTNRIEMGLKDVELNKGDILFFKNYNSTESKKIEYISKINEEGLHCSNSKIVKIQSDLKFIFSLESLKDLSPAITSCTTTVFFQSNYLKRGEYLKNFVIPKLDFCKTWRIIFENVLVGFEKNIIRQIVVYMKHLDNSNSLSFWMGENQFFHSIGYKIIACFELLEKIFSLESDKKETEDNMQEIIKSYAEAIVLNCIICEIEIYLKPQLKIRAGQFFVDTLFNYKRTANEAESNDEKSLTEEDENSELSMAEGNFPAMNFVINEEFARSFVGFYKKNSNHSNTIFSFNFDILRGDWIHWEDIQIHPLRLLKNKEFLKRMEHCYKKMVTSLNERYQELCMNSGDYSLSGFYDSTTGLTNVFVKSIIKCQYWAFILHTTKCKTVLMALNRLSKNSLIESLRKVKHMGDSDYLYINANHVNTKKNVSESLFKKLKNSQAPIDVIIDDLHLGTKNLKFESVINEINQRQVFYNYYDTYWNSNVHSIVMGMMIPDISNSSVFVKSRKNYSSIIRNSSVILIPSIDGKSIERLFVAEIPKSILTQDMVLFAARIGKIYHNMTPYLKFVQNNLGCNISVEIWLRIVHTLSKCQIKKSSFTYKLLVIKKMFQELFEGQWKNLNLNLIENQSEVSARSFDSSFEFTQDSASLPSSKSSQSFTETSEDEFEDLYDELTLFRIPSLERVISSRLMNKDDPSLSKISRYKMSMISTRKKPSGVSFTMGKISSFNDFGSARNSRLIGTLGSGNRPSHFKAGGMFGRGTRGSIAPSGPIGIPSKLSTIASGSGMKPLDNQEDILNVVECEEYLDDSDWYMKIGGGYIESFEMIQTFVVKFDDIISKNILNSEDSEVIRTITRTCEDYDIYNTKVEKAAQIKDNFTPFFKINKVESVNKISKKILEILEDVMIKNLKTQRYSQQESSSIIPQFKIEEDPFNDKNILREFVDKNIIEVVNIEYSYLFSYSKRLMFLLDLPNTNLIVANDNQILSFISLISCRMIHRLFFIIFFKDFHDLAKVKKNLEKCLDLIILDNERVTFIVEYDKRLKFSDYNELIRLLEMFQSSDSIYFLGNKKLKKYVLKLRENVVYNQLGLKDLYQVMKTKIKMNFSVLLRVPSHKLQEASRYMMINHSSFYFKTIFRTFKEIPYTDDFSPINKLLLKNLLNNVDKEIQIQFSKIYFKKDYGKIGETVDKLAFTQEGFYGQLWNREFPIEYIEDMIDFAMMVNIFEQKLQKSKLKTFKSLVLSLVQELPSKNSVKDLRYYNELGYSMEKAMKGINIMKILAYEKIFRDFFKLGFKLMPSQINLISCVLFLLSMRLNFIMTLYDPFGIMGFISSIIKAQFSNLLIDDDPRSRSVLKMAAKSGKNVIVIVKKLTEDDQNFLKNIMRHFILLRFGVIYGFFKNEKQKIDFMHENEKFKISPDFRMAIVFERRLDVRNFCDQIEEIGLKFLRIFAFSDNISFMLKDCVEIHDFIRREIRVRKSIRATRGVWVDKDRPDIARSVKFMKVIFKLNEILVSKKLIDRKRESQSQSPSDENFSFSEISSLLQEFELKKYTTERREMLGKDIELSYKLRGGMMPSDLFESKREIKFMHPLCVDTTAIYMKVLSFNDLILNGKLDPNSLSELFVMSFNIMKIEIDREANKKIQLLRTKSKDKSKNDNKQDEVKIDMSSLEIEERLNYSVFSSKIIYQINSENLDIWNELMIYFVDQFSKSLNSQEKDVFWFWLWLNHSDFGSTNYKKENDIPSFSELLTLSKMSNSRSGMAKSKIGKYYQRKNSKIQAEIEPDEESDIVALFSEMKMSPEDKEKSFEKITYGYDVLKNQFNLPLKKIFSKMTLVMKDKRFIDGNPFNQYVFIGTDSEASSPKNEIRSVEDLTDLMGEGQESPTKRNRGVVVKKKSRFAQLAKNAEDMISKSKSRFSKKPEKISSFAQKLKDRRSVYFKGSVLKDLEKDRLMPPAMIQPAGKRKSSFSKNKELIKLPTLSSGSSKEGEQNCSISSREVDISKIQNDGNNTAFLSFSRYDIDFDNRPGGNRLNRSRAISPVSILPNRRKVSGDKPRRSKKPSFNILSSINNSPERKLSPSKFGRKKYKLRSSQETQNKKIVKETSMDIDALENPNFQNRKNSRMKAYFRNPSIEQFSQITNIKVPDKLNLKFKQIFSDIACANAVYLYKRISKAKNFERYQMMFDHLTNYTKLWIDFYKESDDRVFNEHSKLLIPIEDKSLCNSIKSIELANWVFLTKPFVLKKYLTSIPSVNKYQFSERAYFNLRTAAMNKSSEFINFFYEEDLMINPISILVSALASRYTSYYNQVDNSNHGFINSEPCLIVSDFGRFARDVDSNLDLYEEVFVEKRTIIVDNFDEWEISEKIGFRALIEKLMSMFVNKKKQSMVGSRGKLSEEKDNVKNQKIVLVHSNQAKADESYFKGQTVFVSRPDNLKQVMMRLNCVCSGLYINKLLDSKKCVNFEKMELKRKERDITFYKDLRLKATKFGIKCDIVREFSNLILLQRAMSKGAGASKKHGNWGNPLKLAYVVFFLFGVSILKHHNKPSTLNKSHLLTAHDISLIKSIWEKILTVVVQNPKGTLRKLIKEFFPCAKNNRHNSRLFMPFISSDELLKLFDKYLHRVFDSEDDSFLIEDKVYKFNLDKLVADNFDLVEIINLFPSSDPNVLLGLNPKEKKVRDLDESKNYYGNLKKLFNKFYLKLNFSKDLNPISSVGVNLRNQIAEAKEATDLLNVIISNCENSKLFNVIILFPQILIDNIVLFKKYDTLSRQKVDSENSLKTLSSFKDEGYVKHRKTNSKNSKLNKFRKTLNRRFSTFNTQSPRENRYGSLRNLRISEENTEFSEANSFAKNNGDNLADSRFEGIDVKTAQEVFRRFIKKSDIKLLRRKRIFHSFLLIEISLLIKIGNRVREDFLIAYELLTGELSYEFSNKEDRVLIENLGNDKTPDQYEELLKSCFDKVNGCRRFSSYWENLIRKLNYANTLQNSSDAMPSTGCYDLSGLLNPFSLISSLAVTHALKEKISVDRVQFHSVFYSDFDIGDLNLKVLRITGLKIVNAKLDEDGMLVQDEDQNDFYPIPQLVIMPYNEKNHISEKQIEKEFEISLRKNKNRTVSMKHLLQDPLLVNKFDNDRQSKNDFNKTRVSTLEKFHLIKLPIFLEQSCLNDEFIDNSIRCLFCVDSYKSQEYWNERGIYVTI